jgi:hypothetical protein
MTDSTDDPHPINGPAPDPTDPPPTLEDVLTNLANAMAHAVSRLDDLDATIDDVRDGIETVIQKLSHLHAMGKHQQAALLRLEKILTEGANESDSSAGF